MEVRRKYLLRHSFEPRLRGLSHQSHGRKALRESRPAFSGCQRVGADGGNEGDGFDWVAGFEEEDFVFPSGFFSFLVFLRDNPGEGGRREGFTTLYINPDIRKQWLLRRALHILNLLVNLRFDIQFLPVSLLLRSTALP